MTRACSTRSLPLFGKWKASRRSRGGNTRRNASANWQLETKVAGRTRMMMQSLCETCRNVREVRASRSRFLLCELSVTNATFPKYPPQPVVRCEGFQSRSEAKQGKPDDPPDKRP